MQHTSQYNQKSVNTGTGILISNEIIHQLNLNALAFIEISKNFFN